MKPASVRWRLNLALVVSFILPVAIWLSFRDLLGDDWLIPYYLVWLGFLYWTQRKEPNYDGVPGYGRILIVIILACGFLSGWLLVAVLERFIGVVEVELFPYGLIVGVLLLVAMGWLEVRVIRRYFRGVLPLLKLNGEVFGYFSLGFVAALIS